MKIYAGFRTDRGVEVTVVVVDGNGGRIGVPKPLPPRFDLRNHSPTGFEWGYGGSGPAQLALALCADALGNDRRAQDVYQHFKWAHVTKFPNPGWTYTDEQVKVDVAALEGT